MGLNVLKIVVLVVVLIKYGVLFLVLVFKIFFFKFFGIIFFEFCCCLCVMLESDFDDSRFIWVFYRDWEEWKDVIFVF